MIFSPGNFESDLQDRENSTSRSALKFSRVLAFGSKLKSGVQALEKKGLLICRKKNDGRNSKFRGPTFADSLPARFLL